MDEKNKSNNFISKNNGDTTKMKLSFIEKQKVDECNNNRYNYNFSYDLKISSKDSNRFDTNKSNNKKNCLNKKNLKRNISTNYFRNSKIFGNLSSKNQQIKKSSSQNKIISKSKDKNNKNLYEKEFMNKLKFSLKKEKDEEEKNFNLKVIMNSNSKDYLNRHKNTNSNNNYYMTNKIIFLSPNKYSNNNKTKEFSLKPQKNNKKNKNNFKLGKNNHKISRDNQNNNLNLFYNNETKNTNIHENVNIFLNSLNKTNIKNHFNLNKNDFNIIKEEKEIESKKIEELNNSCDFLNCDESNNSFSKGSIFNSYKKEKSIKKISNSKVEIRTETNLDKLYSLNKDKYKNKTKQKTNHNKRKNKFNTLQNHKNKQMEVSFNRKKYALSYPKKQKRNKTTSSKNKHQNRICFIMNDDIISDNKNANIKYAGTKLKKNKNNLNTNLGKFTNDTEINKIQDILSHGDKTFSELAYDKGLSDVVNQIPSPNSHRGSKDIAPKSIQNPNENYGPFKSLFSVGLDKKDESSISNSPCCSRSNSSSRVVKIINSSKKNKYKNLKKNYTNLVEDEKEKINKNNFIEKNKINKNDKEKEKDKDDNIVVDEEKKCDNYPDPIWSEQDNELSSNLKNNLINEDLSSKYNTFINQLIKGVEEKNNKKNMNINIDLNDNEKENKLKEFEEDCNLLSQMKTEFEKLEENYDNECGKINDKIFRTTRVSNFILQQSFPNNRPLQNSILSFAQRLEKIDNQYNKEVKNYKKTIQSLIEQLKIISGGTEDCIDKKLLQEMKDIQFSERQIFDTFLENKRSSNDKNSQNSENQELIKELERFKHEEKEYKFLIPQKYSFDKNKTKLLKNGIIKGLFVKVYENKVIDIINKHGTTKRIFPDGFQISFYNNKDIKLRFTNKDEFCLYHVNQAEEFRFPSKGIIIYKFKNGQFEKHYSNYEMDIKFSDGSYRIIRKEKELFQYPNGILEFKDKKGNKSYMEI